MADFVQLNQVNTWQTWTSRLFVSFRILWKDSCACEKKLSVRQRLRGQNFSFNLTKVKKPKLIDKS